MDKHAIISRAKSLWHDRRGTSLIEFAFVFPVLLLLLFGGIEITRYIIIVQKVEKAVSTMSSIVTQESPAVAAGPAGPASGINAAELRVNVFPNYDSVMVPFNCCTATPTEAIMVTSLIKMPVGSVPGCTAPMNAACVRVRWQAGYLQPGSSGDPTWTSAITGISANDSGAMRGLCTNIFNPVTGALQRRDCTTVTGLSTDVGNLPLTADERNSIINMIPNENMLVTEVFYQYQPFLEPLLSGISTVNDGAAFSVVAAPLAKRVFAYPRNGPLYDLPPDFPPVP